MALTKVSSSLVSDNAVTSGKIADGGIATADIADVAVTTAKIANNAILTQHIDDGQVTTDQLGADAVTAAKIADDAISEEHLDVTVITSLTAVTAATGDLLMVADVSDSNNLKKIPVSSILAGTHTGAVNTSGTINSGALGVTGNIAVSGTVDGIDIAARDAVLTSTTTTAGAALPKAGGTMSGSLNMGSQTITNAGTIASDTIEINTNANSNTHGLNITNSALSGAGSLKIAIAGSSGSYANGETLNDIVMRNETSGGSIIIAAPDSVQIGVGGNDNQTRFTIDSSGNATFTGTVALADDKELQLGNSTDIKFKHHNSGYGHLENSGILYIDAEQIQLRTDNSDVGLALTLNASHEALFAGKVGVKTTSPQYDFDVYSTSDISMRVHRPSSGLALTDTCGIGFSHRGDTNTSSSDTRAAIVSTYNGSLFLCTEPGGNLNSNPVDHAALSIIGTSQNVGIGTDAPDTKLHVFKATAGTITNYANNALVVENSGDVGISLLTPNAGAGHLMFGSPGHQYHSYIRGGYGASTTSTLKFYTDNINTMTHKAGKVGIGTDNPAELLHLKGGTGNNSTGAPIIRIQKHSGGAVDDGQTIGGMSFWVNDDGVDSGAPKERAKIIAESQNTSSATRLEFYTSGNTTAIEERMRIQGDGTTVLTNADGNANLGRLQFSTQASTYNIFGGNNVGYLGYRTGGYHRWFGSDGNEDWRINSSGHFTPANQHAMDIGGTNAEVRNIYAQGISFASNAHTSGMTSELLDDYEEGTWTPTITFGGGSTGQVYNRRQGKYIKIGSLVYIQGHLYFTNKGSSTGQAGLAGLPFPPSSNSSGTFSPIGDRGNLNTGGRGVNCYLHSSSTTFPLYDGGFDGSGNSDTNYGDFNNSTEIDVNFCYYTDA